jgi:DNA-directed RNA polymerase specialized sigma24 family protein
MSDRDMVAALSAGDRLVAGQMYDAYGTRLYVYCYERLADQQLATDVLRDTFIVAAGRANELRSPDELGAWLYAIARCESLRVGLSEDVPADAAGSLRGERFARVALDCYALLSPDRRELLDLAFRHRMVDEDIALVRSLDPEEVARRVAEVQDILEYAMTAVFAYRDNDPRCQDAAALGARFDELEGKHIDAWFASVAAHGAECQVCADYVRAHRPLQLFEDLPQPFVPPGVRTIVLDALRDPEGDEFRDRVARRAGAFDDNGFPLAGRKGGGDMRRLLLPIGGLAAAVAVAVVLVFALFGTGGSSHRTDNNSAQLNGTVTTTPPPTSATPTPTTSDTPTPSATTTTVTPTPTNTQDQQQGDNGGQQQPPPQQGSSSQQPPPPPPPQTSSQQPPPSTPSSPTQMPTVTSTPTSTQTPTPTSTTTKP